MTDGLIIDGAIFRRRSDEQCFYILINRLLVLVWNGHVDSNPTVCRYRYHTGQSIDLLK